MTTIAEVRAALADVLTTLPDWTVLALPNGDRNAYIGDGMMGYCLKIARPAFDPRMVFSQAKVTVTFNVTAYAPRATPETSEAALDALCDITGDNSLIAAVQDGTLWSVDVDSAQVVRCGEVQLVTWIDNVEYLACQFQIEVMW